MFPMSSILEHVCTYFIVNGSTQESFLKIVLDARQIAFEAITATSKCDKEIFITAHHETTEGDSLIRREVRQVLTVPSDVMVRSAKFVLLKSGFLVIDIPFKMKFYKRSFERATTSEAPNDDELSGYTSAASPTRSKIQQLTYAIGPNNRENQLDRHQTTREGNQLLLRIPLDHSYSHKGVTVKVVNRSVCVSATRLEKSNVLSAARQDGKPYLIQRNFYKEYEASDLVPDPESIVYELKDNWLLVRVSALPDAT
ncbi:hypothetical protein FBUS_01944 [Fasciolopsis buskii]|uniref:SHSP domain-containing protein n=1 Tax=Fasciolopsis buskii TaxID=27845 RepID=A0A8E0VH11_9TREM|nr:hypothetical protein FBUS_01944 [Fasciolopsis buski]